MSPFMYVPDSGLDITYCQEMHQIYSKRTVNTPGKFYFLMQFSPCYLAGVDCGPICTAGHHHFSVCVCVLFGQCYTHFVQIESRFHSSSEWELLVSSNFFIAVNHFRYIFLQSSRSFIGGSIKSKSPFRTKNIGFHFAELIPCLSFFAMTWKCRNN